MPILNPLTSINMYMYSVCNYALNTLNLLVKMSSLYQSFLQFSVTVDVPFEVFHMSILVPLLSDELLEVPPIK